MKQMKKILALLLCLLLLLQILPAASLASNVIASGYCGGEGNGKNLQWTIDDAGTLRITGSGRMKDYDAASDAPWYDYLGELVCLQLNEGITTIGRNAFQQCYYFQSALQLPGTLTSIGDYSFEGCENFIGELSVPDSVTYIGDWAFSGCRGLSGIFKFPDSLQYLGESVFVENGFTEYCSSNPEFPVINGMLFNSDRTELISCPKAFSGPLTIPDGTKVISDNAFAACREFRGKLILPQGLEVIGDSAFAACTGLIGSLELPDSLTSIGVMAFNGCEGITGTVVIPADLESIGFQAFRHMHGITAFASESSDFMVYDDILYNSDGTVLIVCPPGKTGPIRFLDGVGVIYDFAFEDCTGLTGQLVIPDSVSSIGQWAFYGCTGLSGELRLPKEVAYIDGFAFYGCTGLSGDLDIPQSAFSIGTSAFEGCTGLGSRLTIPESVEYMDFMAFHGCSGIRDVYFGGEVPSDDIEWNYLFPQNVVLHCKKDAKSWIEDPAFNPITCSFAGYRLRDYDGHRLTADQGFSDVPDDAYYADAVKWALDMGITNGISDTKFSPDASCTRGQMVTFLWRAAGCPEPVEWLWAFYDIDPEDYYFEAVLWAYENGIVNGTEIGTFSPNQKVTRGQMATILYRYADGTASGAIPFRDVAKTAYYYDPIRWAYAEGITTGISATKFAPEQPCTRCQIVTFLNRFFEE